MSIFSLKIPMKGVSFPLTNEEGTHSTVGSGDRLFPSLHSGHTLSNWGSKMAEKSAFCDSRATE